MPIDDAVINDEQFSIDLYARNGLITNKLDARTLLDDRCNAALARGVRA